MLTEDEDGLEQYEYPSFRFGHAWWIPDSVIRFISYPWVIGL